MKIYQNSKYRLSVRSFGVNINLNSNDKRLIEIAGSLLTEILAGRFDYVKSGKNAHELTLEKLSTGLVDLHINDELRYPGLGASEIPNRLSSLMRITVAEYARGRAFIHAGAVSWKGKGIIIPARSFKGKSTLTAELVRCGAKYFSDEYAVLDKKGMLYPFPKHLSLRGIRDDYSQVDHSVDSIGGVAGKRPVPVKLVVITEFQKDAKWKPRSVSPGTASIAILNNSVSIRRDPKFVIPAVGAVCANSVAVKSKRGSAEETAPHILELLETTT
jgi:hypothetical protein